MLGQTVSHYRILEKLGEGGMGVVYRAEDTKLHRPVALKFLSPEMTRDESAKKRFIQEARSISSLDHPNIAVVHEVDETAEGQAFICMAYYEGPTIKKRLEEGPLSIEEAIRIAYQIADGLERAHESGVVHRDIKPANIIITERGQAKIVDFGIARLAGETKFRSPSETAGTAAYMSPEQAQGSAADNRSDLFALGIVLYEMATGRRPFQGDHDAAVLYSIVNVDPPKPSDVREDISPALDSVILKLLEKHPDRRYQSADEVHRDLGRLLGISPGRIVPRPSRRNRTLRVALAVAGIAAVLALVPGAREFLVSRIESIVAPERRTVVVLPFSVLTEDSLARDLGTGLTATVTSTLSQVERFGQPLGVIPASSVREARISTAEEAHSKFGATHVIAGEIQRLGPILRVTVSVIDARELLQEGSNLEDYPVADLARIQDEISTRLAELLGIQLAAPLKTAFADAGTASSDAFRYYSRGRSYLERHEQVANIDFAIGLFQRALKADSTYGLAFAGLGEAYWRKYRRTSQVEWTDSAQHACARALELVPNLPETRVTLGMIYQGTGRYDQALQEHKRALQLNESSVDALIGIGNAYEALGRYGEADSVYRSAIAAAPGYWDTYNNYGYFLLLSAKDIDGAIDQFRAVTRLAPDNIFGYNNLGGALMYRDRWAEAKGVFDKSLSIAPSVAAISNLGTIYFYYEKDYTKAASVYEQGVRLNEQNYILWWNLASAYYQLPARREDARKAYRRALDLALEALRINPKDASLAADAARSLAMLGKRQEALRYLDRALEGEERSPEIMLAFIETYEQLTMRKEALAWVEEGLGSGLSAELIERSPQMAGLVADARYKALRSSLRAPQK